MSRLYKKDSIIIGEPLRIDAEPGKKAEDRPSDNGDAEDMQTVQNLHQSEENRGDIIENARVRAAEIMSNAILGSKKAEREAKQKGYQEGYEEGRNKGYSDGEKEGFARGHEKGRQQGLSAVDENIKEALDIKKRALQNKERMVKEAEHEIVRLVVEISKKVLDHEIKTNPEAITGLVRKALKKCTYSGEVTVKVSPEDYELVESSRQRLLSKMDGITRLNIVAQEAMPRGSCVLETGAGNIASGVEVQLDRIEKIFKGLLNHE